MDPAADFLADLLAGVGDQPDNPAPERARVPRLFSSTEEFARAALDSAAPDLRVDDDGEMLAFRPPDDLVQRLSVLPPSYLKKHDVTERMRVTFDRQLAQRKLDEARQTKTLWPEIAYLSDLHPMVEWLTDKVLLRVPRQQAPVLIASVTAPTFLIQGVYSNALGQPTVVEWMAVTGLPDEPRRGGHDDCAAAARVSARPWSTPSSSATSTAFQELVPAAVDAAREHLEASARRPTTNRSTGRSRTTGPGWTWQQLSLDALLPRHGKRNQEVRGTAGELAELTDGSARPASRCCASSPCFTRTEEAR